MRGIPFLRGGRSLEGADCLGLVLLFLKRKGIEVRDPWEEIAEAFFLDQLDARDHMPNWVRVEPDAIEAGDVVVTLGGRHVAVYVGGGYVLETRERGRSFLMPIRRCAPDREWFRRRTASERSGSTTS